LTIKDVPDDEMIIKIKNYKEKTVLAKKGKRQWPLWICPFLIQNSPFTKTLWLDCDLIILRNLEKLFQKLDTGPFFTPENLAPNVTANKAALYKLLPIKHTIDENKALINAGVSGWHLTRDKKILNDYANVVKKAFENEDIKNAISWHDQGSLIWAILNTGSEKRIATDWTWNLCVKHTKIKELKFTWHSQLLDELRKQVPEANILHWNGQPVPWL
jgi:lipopolysaccharide biosynthesis glycosyltransferase